jgi:hypothetical protein
MSETGRFRVSVEMMEMLAGDCRDALDRIRYWRDYALRLEDELGAALHGPKALPPPKRDSDVTETV